MAAQTNAEKIPNSHPTGSVKLSRPEAVVSSVIHRVCIQCNNMFRVSPDRFDAKQCPNCHKG